MTKDEPTIRDPEWSHLRRVVQAALEIPTEARTAFLDQECAGDDELRIEVESLLSAHERAGSFLSRPAIEPAASAEGRRLGPYRVLNELGRGGMAVVYRAVRDDDLFQKTVAVKLMSGGAGASENLLRRFSQERRILGRLQHSNIAAVFDGGATSEGQPYLVMELIEGRPITKYCDALDLSTKQRLEMFRAVCEAVQYAHQNLVIHRDLKPANILVNDNGEPKLLDFGIAKLLAGADGEEAPTQTMMPMMTPEYASPEQVRGEAITTSSDIYSLGVLLFELLTGELPYPVGTGSLQEIVRSVCEVEPPAPSTIARKRATVSALRGDLDTIVLKALRKEPQRRYVSVHELAEDVRHYLEGRPVAARSDSLAYRFMKFAGRNSAAATAAGLVLLSLIGGIVASLAQARRADVERGRAERRFADVRHLANSLLFELHDAIADLPGSTPARELLVTRATEYLTSLSREADTDPELQRELATAYQRLGDVQGNLSGSNLGDAQGALASYEKSLQLRRSLASRESRDPGDAEKLAFLLSQMGRFFTGTGDWNRAEESARESISLLRQLDASRSSEQDFRGRLAVAHHTLGFILLREAKPDDAYGALQTAADYARDFHDAHQENPDTLLNLAYIDSDLSESLRLRGELKEAASVSQEASRLFRELLEKEPSHPRYTRGLIVALSSEADALDALGEHRPAIEVRERALEASNRFLASDESNASALLGVAYANRSLGRTLFLAGDAGTAFARLREAVAVGERAVAQASDAAWARNELASAYAELANSLEEAGAETSEFCAARMKALSLWEALEAEGRLPGDTQPDYEQLRKRGACNVTLFTRPGEGAPKVSRAEVERASPG